MGIRGITGNMAGSLAGWDFFCIFAVLLRFHEREVAQWLACLHRLQEVGGSIPPPATIIGGYGVASETLRCLPTLNV